MNTVTKVRIPSLPVETSEFSRNPTPFLEAARAVHPWLATFSQGYVVHGYKAVSDLLGDSENLVPGQGPVIDFYGVRGTMWARFMEEIVLSASGPTHVRLRASVRRAFLPSRAEDARPLMRQAITEVLDEWAPKNAFDFAAFASNFPIRVICALLGVSAAEAPRLRNAVESHIGALALNLAAKPLFLAAWEELWAFADALVLDREATGQYDDASLLDVLIRAKTSGDLDEVELRFMLLTVFLGGYDSTVTQLTWAMRTLMEHPDLYARCAWDKDYCGKVIEESLRLASPATPYRVAARSFEYGGVSFEAGDLLVMALPLADHDPAVFSEPLVFDPERENAKRHVAFGRGGHMCLGMFIARTLMQEGLHLIAQRLKHPRLDGEIEFRPFLGSWGVKSLPIAFDSA